MIASNVDHMGRKVRRNRIPAIPSSNITPRAVWEGRRRFLRAAAGGAAAALLPTAWAEASVTRPGRLDPIAGIQETDYGKDLKPTDYADFTTYNNFVELGAGKEAPARNAHLLRTRASARRLARSASRTY